MKTLILNCNNDSNVINKAVSLLKNGGIGIFPTDTVYGIGCNCFNINGINNLYQVKHRNFKKPICILVSNTDMVKKLVKNISPLEQKLMDVFWPGDLTIIFNKSKMVPDILTSGLSTVGIRMPNNKICLDLINSLESPLATSSANLADEAPSITVDKKLLADFSNKVAFIIDSSLIPHGMPSTIIRVENNEVKILREGSISLDKINELISQERIEL